MNETTMKTQWVKTEHSGYVRADTIEGFKLVNGSVLVSFLTEGKQVELLSGLAVCGPYGPQLVDTLVKRVAFGASGILDCGVLRTVFRVRYDLSKYTIAPFYDQETINKLALIAKEHTAFEERVEALGRMTLETFCCDLDVSSFCSVGFSGYSSTEAEFRWLLNSLIEKLVTPKSPVTFPLSVNMLSYSPQYAYYCRV